MLRDSEGHIHATGAARAISSFESEYVVFRPDVLVKLNLPKKAEIATLACGRLLVKLDEDWTPSEDNRFTAGSVISYDLDEWKQDPPRAKASLVFQPGPGQALSELTATKNFLILTILENVQSKAFVYKYDQGAWSATPIPLPEHTGVSLSATYDKADRVMFTVSSYLGPTSVWYFDAESKRLEELKKTPSAFDASNHVLEQLEATSRDGTSIPYFLVRPKNARFDGAIPTLLHGYGGFQTPLLPSDLGPGAALARTGQCLCRCEPARRRRIWPTMASSRPGGNEADDMG